MKLWENLIAFFIEEGEMMISILRKIFGIKEKNKPNGEDHELEEECEKCKVTEVEALEAENEIFRMARHEHETLQPFVMKSQILRNKLKELDCKKKESSGNLGIVG